MRIQFIHYGSVQSENGSYFSPLASMRYRAIIPSIGLAKLGHDISFYKVDGKGSVDFDKATNATHLIFTKLTVSQDYSINLRRQEKSLAIAEAAKSRGVFIITDISDDHFESDLFSRYYFRLIELSTKITVCSGVLAAVVAERTKKEIVVISDPVESKQQTPKFNPPKLRNYFSYFLAVLDNAPQLQKASLKLLWYGHRSNLAGLESFFPALEKFSKKLPVSLNIVTDLESTVLQEAKKSVFINSNSLVVTFTSWSVSATWEAINECDIVILPSFSGHHAKRAKSPNRLLEAIWGGRFVVSSAIPAYNVFRNWVWVDDDLIAGITWAINHPREVKERIREAQKYIITHHSPEVIASNWMSVLSTPMMDIYLSSTEERKVLGLSNGIDSGDEIKLNLGCGDKILDGYINVDIAPSRLGKRPNIICDLRSLSVIKSDVVNEILSIHVIEHFWRWEVRDVLREWIRVLKPGGKMILECPNLISACEALLADPVLSAGEGVEGQRSMWVFYGDPKWHDPLMVHRWGYTPDSLSRLMKQVGLVNVRQEPAQFKLREPRDMRIVGEKSVTLG